MTFSCSSYAPIYYPQITAWCIEMPDRAGLRFHHHHHAYIIVTLMMMIDARTTQDYVNYFTCFMTGALHMMMMMMMITNTRCVQCTNTYTYRIPILISSINHYCGDYTQAYRGMQREGATLAVILKS